MEQQLKTNIQQPTSSTGIRKNERLEVVDALRGIALCAIVIIHCQEHYNLYFIPENAPQWLTTIDKGIWQTTWFLLAGKAFSAFSLLFGFSFFIQYDNAQRRGIPFRGRFAWRMLLLVMFSQLHSLFYNGDILFLYAVMGLLLIAVCRCQTRTVLALAILLILQPLEWIRLLLTANGIPFIEYGNHWMKFASLAKPVMESGSFLEVVQSNITYGQLYGNLWQIENGRICQIGGLFLFGLVAGRLQLFVKSQQSIMWWKRLIGGAVLLFIPFYLLKISYPDWTGGNAALNMPLEIATSSISNFLLMTVLAGCFVLAWFSKEKGYGFQRLFIPYGRMSLTNYITQSIIGITLFYGFGLGLYRYTGATVCLLIGIVIVIIQMLFSRFWLSSHKQGPLERIWKKLTWI